jgi:hypothetical protein
MASNPTSAMRGSQVIIRLIGRFFALTTTLVCASSIAISQEADYPFAPAQRSAVEQLLADSARARLVLTTDCTNANLADYQKEHPAYLPYFCEGDFDSDGKTDFIVAIRAGSRFDLFLFRAKGNEFRKPSWFASMDWLNECGIFRRDGSVLVGKFYSNDATTFVWNKVPARLEEHPASNNEE